MQNWYHADFKMGRSGRCSLVNQRLLLLLVRLDPIAFLELGAIVLMHPQRANEQNGITLNRVLPVKGVNEHARDPFLLLLSFLRCCF